MVKYMKVLALANDPPETTDLAKSFVEFHAPRGLVFFRGCVRLAISIFCRAKKVSKFQFVYLFYVSLTDV